MQYHQVDNPYHHQVDNPYHHHVDWRILARLPTKNAFNPSVFVDVDTQKMVITVVMLMNAMIQLDLHVDLLLFAPIWTVDSSAIVPLDTLETHSPSATRMVSVRGQSVTCLPSWLPRLVTCLQTKLWASFEGKSDPVILSFSFLASFLASLEEKIDKKGEKSFPHLLNLSFSLFFFLSLSLCISVHPKENRDLNNFSCSLPESIISNIM